MSVVPINRATPIQIVEAAGKAIAGQRREINSELSTLRAEIAQLRQAVDALPSGTVVATALTASKVLGKRYLGEVRRGLAQLRGAADNISVNDDVISQDEFIAAALNRVNGAIAEWHLAKSISPNISLRMKDSSKPNLGGGRKLTDHLRICLLRTVEHQLGGNPVEIVVRGQSVRMCEIGVMLIQRCAEARAEVKGLRGDYKGDAKTLQLASLLADARLLLGADADEVKSVEVAIEDVSDTITESAQRCEDSSLRLSDLYAQVRRAHLEKADGLVPELSGDIEVEFQRLSAEAENAWANSAADRSIYRMRHLSDYA